MESLFFQPRLPRRPTKARRLPTAPCCSGSSRAARTRPLSCTAIRPTASALAQRTVRAGAAPGRSSPRTSCSPSSAASSARPQGDYDVPVGEELWRLFLVIALNKIRAKGNYQLAAKRDARRTVRADGLDDLAAEADLGFLRVTVEEALEKLSPQHREMVTLRIEGHEVAEIARLTNRSHRTVERLLQQARQRLTELMEGGDMRQGAASLRQAEVEPGRRSLRVAQQKLGGQTPRSSSPTPPTRSICPPCSSWCASIWSTVGGAAGPTPWRNTGPLPRCSTTPKSSRRSRSRNTACASSSATTPPAASTSAAGRRV